MDILKLIKTIPNYDQDRTEKNNFVKNTLKKNLNKILHNIIVTQIHQAFLLSKWKKNVRTTKFNMKTIKGNNTMRKL